MKKFFVVALIAVALALASVATACKDDEPEHVHDWVAGETTPATYDTDGQETEKCTTCGAIRVTQTIAKFKTEQPFTIGSVNFIFEYRKDDTTSWGKLESGVELYRTNITSNPEGAEAATIDDLAAKADKPANASYRIVVDYSNEGKNAGFTAIDGQTITVGSEFLSTTTVTRSMLRNAFNAMVVSPW